MPRPAPSVEARDIDSGPVAETDSWSVSARRVHHVEPWLISLAYRVDTAEGSVLFAGDCADCPELRDAAKGVDTLVVACAHLGRAKASRALGDVCTGAAEAADIASAAGVKRVVLSHGPPGARLPENRKRYIDRVAGAYDGTVLFPDELAVVDLNP